MTKMEQQIGKDITRKEEYGWKMRSRTFGKTETDGQG
jgi:hypothetical protein